MAATSDAELGEVLATFPKVTVHERGLVARQWGKQVVLPWEAVTSIYYHLSKETFTVVLIPVAELNTRKLTLAADDGVSVVLHGAPTEQVYGLAVAATTERRLARALDRLQAGETISFGLLSISREALTYTVLRWIGPFPVVPWAAVASVGLEEGWVQLTRRDPDKPNASLGSPQRIAAAWAVDNLDIFQTLAHALAYVDPTIDPDRKWMKTCPGCGGVVKPFVRVCQHCWRRVSREEFFQQLPPAAQEQHRQREGLFTDDARAPARPAGADAPARPMMKPAAPAGVGKTCPRCKWNRTDTDLTCPHCGYTDWGAILCGGVFGVALLLAALLWAPVIETPWLQGAVRWGCGLVGAFIVLFIPFAAVKGMRAAGKPVPAGADPGPAAPSPADGGEPVRSAPAPSGAQNFAALLNSLNEGGVEQLAAALNNSSPADVKELARRLAEASPDALGKKASARAEGAEASPPGRGSPPPPASDATTIPFSCPACGRKLRVKAEMAGKHAKCPGCKQQIQIPRKTLE